MKITKIDDISHYKKQDKGVLKQQDKNLSEKEEIKKKVEQRFNAQIKSRVNKEFVKLIKEKRQEEKNFDKFIGELNNINNKKEQEWDLSNVSVEFFKENIKIIKNEKVIEELIIKLLEKGKKDKKSVIEYEEYKKLQKYLEEKHNKIKLFNIKSKKGEKFHNFIMELYSGEEQKWDLSEISIEDITENEKVKLQYKLKDLNRNDEENSSYLYKDNNNNKIYCYIDLIKKILNKNKEEKTREKIINSKEYTELRSHFINYKNIKIDKLTKSLINNKVNIKVVNDIITGQSNREKSLLEFFEEIIKNKEKPILKDKLESIKIENIFDGELIQDIKEIMEKRRESQTEGEIGN